MTPQGKFQPPHVPPQTSLDVEIVTGGLHQVLVRRYTHPIQEEVRTPSVSPHVTPQTARGQFLPGPTSAPADEGVSVVGPDCEF